MALSFAKDIRPLFRDTPDVDTMKDFGLDLSSFDSVKITRKRFTRVFLMAVCPAMSRGPRSRLPCSSSGWKKEWRPNGDPNYPLSNACFFSNSSNAARISASNLSA